MLSSWSGEALLPVVSIEAGAGDRQSLHGSRADLLWRRQLKLITHQPRYCSRASELSASRSAA